MRSAALALFFLLAAPAAAQTTNCYRVGNMVQCNTTPSPSYTPLPMPQPPAFNMSDTLRAAAALREARAREEAARAAAEAGAAHERDRATRVDRARRVGLLIDSGQCAEASALALREGDLEMAELANRICQR